MEAVEQRFAADSEIGLFNISVTDKNGGKSERRLLSIVQRDPAGNYSYLIRFLAPENIRGVTLVTREQGAGESEQFLYLPARGGEVTHIEGSNKSVPFMGTDFSYEDLRRENSKDYIFEREFDDVYDGKECYQILSTPADKQKVQAKGYSNRMILVEKETYRILKIDYYNESQVPIKTFVASNYGSAQVDGPTERPHNATMTTHGLGSKSVMTLEKSRINYTVDPRVFTERAVKEWTRESTNVYLKVFNQQASL